LGIDGLVGALQSLTGLKELCISGTGVNSHDIERLVPALKGKQLEYLNISNNDVKGSGPTMVLSAGLFTLHRLDLSSIGLGPNPATLVSLLPKLEDLEELYLDSNMLKAAELVALTPAIAKIPELKVLSLANNAIRGDAGLKALASLAKSLPSLQRLDLSGNRLILGGAQPSSFQQMLTSLKQANHLRVLDISDNDLLYENILQLFTTLHHVHTMKLRNSAFLKGGEVDRPAKLTQLGKELSKGSMEILDISADNASLSDVRTVVQPLLHSSLKSICVQGTTHTTWPQRVIKYFQALYPGIVFM